MSNHVTGPDDDQAYVEACRGGDTEAFSVLVARHSKKMINLAYRLIGDYDEACDAVQEAFLSAFKGIGGFKADAAFATWLHRIVVNASINRLRRRQTIAQREMAESNEAKDIPENAACDGAFWPDRQLERREREAAVWGCIRALDDVFRTVLVLRDIEGLSYEEITATLNIPDGTVKSRLARARLALKNCLKKVMGAL